MRIEEYYESRKKLVDEAVKKYVEEHNLTQIASTALSGKRLRGVLLLLMAEALGGDVNKALPLAVAIELAHAASLDVDDIVDLDVVRRGQPAQWVVKGILKTVLGSHALVSHVLDIARSYGKEYLDVLVETYTKMVKGEMMDLDGGGPYETIVTFKTASLFAASAAVGALVAGEHDAVDAARQYGLAVGIAFQIADDTCDVFRLIEKGDLSKLFSPSVHAFLASLGLEVFLSTSPLAVLKGGLNHLKEKAMEIIVFRKIPHYIERAKEAVSKLPVKKPEFDRLLMDYPSFCVEKMFQECGLRV